MERIKTGKFSLQGEEWASVSSAAKNIIEGIKKYLVLRHLYTYNVVT